MYSVNTFFLYTNATILNDPRQKNDLAPLFLTKNNTLDQLNTYSVSKRLLIDIPWMFLLADYLVNCEGLIS